ncbi:MAG: glycosyl hydrolase family 28 protein [Bacteroides sp.]|nr:glycosyl hydrolase family 28 protein [Bacteroides sp.]
MTLRLSPGDEAVVEINGSEEHSLFIFVNPLETDRPDPSDPDIIYFKAGSVHNEPNLSLKSGQTLYLEGGAVLKGNITSSGADGIAIRGCGVIDSREVAARAIQLEKADGLHIENVTLINNINWSTLVSASNDVSIDNYKVVAVENPANATGCENDALDLLGCKDAKVTGCFAYCHDDVYCVKSHKWDFAGEVSNVVFEDCIAWNYLSGNSFVIGAETDLDISGVTYRNCYSIHSGGRPTTLYRGGLGIHHCAGGHVSDILFEDIFLEDCKEYGIYIDIRETSYQIGNGVTWRPGTMDGITLRNVNLLHQAKYRNVFYGYDSEEHRIRNVKIENLVIDGKKVTASDMEKMFFAVRNTEYTIE